MNKVRSLFKCWVNTLLWEITVILADVVSPVWGPPSGVTSEVVRGVPGLGPINSKAHEEDDHNEYLLWASIWELTTKTSVTSLVVSIKYGSSHLKRVEQMCCELHFRVLFIFNVYFILFYWYPQWKQVEQVLLWA